MSDPAKVSRLDFQHGSFWRWLLPSFVLVIAYGLQRSVALLGLDLHHDSLMFDAARRMLNGELPFKDFFYQYNLATVFFHVLAVKTLGSQIASLKIATAIVYALIALLIYSCAAVQGSRWRGFGVAMAWSTLSPFYMPAMNGYHAWSTVYMMASIMAGALALMMALRSRPMLWSTLAGVCFNLAFWFKQIAGLQILAVLGWIIYCARRPVVEPADIGRFKRIFFGYAIGGSASALPFFLYLWDQSLIPDWLRSAFVFNGFFSVSGSSTSGVVAFVRTIFPVAGDLGYISVVWAMMPLGMLAIASMREPASGVRLVFRSDPRALNGTLFLALGLAAWAEYFPLAHAFHTQLFMAPVFVLFAIWRADIPFRHFFSDRQQIVLAVLIGLVVGAVVYEAARHMQGLRAKTSREMLELWGDGPTGGLKLEPNYARSFTQFYDAFLAAKNGQGSLPSIPMSVDPLRALLPDGLSEPPTFKMGLDWTWPNEIVEPGFNQLRAKKVAERKSLVYADSPISIPGYIPVALLEMPSPMTTTHTLYVPSSDQMVTEPQTMVVREADYVSSKAFPAAERTAITSGEQPLLMDFFRLDLTEQILAEELAQIHVSVVRPEDVPHVLSSFEVETYLSVLADENSRKTASLYHRRSNGRYKLVWPLKHEQTLGIAKFLLSTGKLFERQDRPVYFSTLSVAPDHRPFLATLTPDGERFKIAWAKESVKGSLSARETSNSFLKDVFLAIPAGAINRNEESILYVQIVAKNRTTLNFYIDYWPREN